MHALTQHDEHLAQQILLLGHHLRQLSAKAPYFGPRASEAIQGPTWEKITALREQLKAHLQQLSPNMGLYAMLKLESEGCGENFHNTLLALHGGKAPEYQGMDSLSDEERGLLKQETQVFLSRLLALKGNPDPEHGVESYLKGVQGKND